MNQHSECYIREKEKSKLPYEMWSMNKLKPNTKEIDNWIKKYNGPYLISCKLDGISALYIYNKEKDQESLFTRGNGIYGQDITSLIPYLIHKKLNMSDPKTGYIINDESNISNNFDKNYAIRGEIIIKKNIYNKNYSNSSANSRNFVAGIINKKVIDPEILLDIDFVPYEVIDPILTPLDQLKIIQNEWILPPVKYDLIDKITNELLSEKLNEWRENYDYLIDGIIVTDNKIYNRISKNPEHSFAFKQLLSDEYAETSVVDVIWTPSKDGYLKPVVVVEPIELDGVCIKKVTGNNANYIEKNKIGIGAKLKIIRSGNVISKIEEILEPATKILLPSIEEYPNYKWNDTHIDIYIPNKKETSDDEPINSVIIEKNITLFFKNLEVEGLGTGNVTKIINAGFDTIPKILAMSIDDFLTIDTFKEKMATKIYTSILEKINKASLSELAASSNTFERGFGKKKLEHIFNSYPDLIKIFQQEIQQNKKDLIIELNKLPHMSDITSEKFIDKLPYFISFLKEAKLNYKIDEFILANSIKPDISDQQNKVNEQNKVKVIMTGFRDKELSKYLESKNIEVQPAMNKQTDYLLVKTDENKNDNSSKINFAKKYNIRIVTPDELKILEKLN